ELGNHALRAQRWRYIRYRDGTEELYDCENDPNEWTNLAEKPAYAAVKKDMARWLPNSDAPGVPTKGAYSFDPKTYTWTKKGAK
ncbi:MAG: choline-sulfatase, partial [Planctomycetota bacterium]